MGKKDQDMESECWDWKVKEKHEKKKNAAKKGKHMRIFRRKKRKTENKNDEK